jgi:hypothetical protein
MTSLTFCVLPVAYGMGFAFILSHLSRTGDWLSREFDRGGIWRRFQPSSVQISINMCIFTLHWWVILLTKNIAIKPESNSWWIRWCHPCNAPIASLFGSYIWVGSAIHPPPPFWARREEYIPCRNLLCRTTFIPTLPRPLPRTPYQ